MVSAIDEFACDILLQAGDEAVLSYLDDEKRNELLSVTSRRVEDTIVVNSLRDEQDARKRRYVVIPGRLLRRLRELPDADGVMRRVLRAALRGFYPGRRLPKSWGPFHYERFFQFYVSTIGEGNRGERARAIIELGPEQTTHVVLSHLDQGMVDLPSYVPPADVGDDFERVLRIVSALPSFDEPKRVSPLDRSSFELTYPAGAMVTDQLTYAEWFPRLTLRQRELLGEVISKPTTLRGAAGTGKTLSLVMKALYDAYEAADEGNAWSSIIITHNWTSAETVRQMIESMDDRAIVNRGDLSIDVHTLQSLAVEQLQLSLRDIEPISEDGYEGKQMQHEVVESLLDEFCESEWRLYRDRTSEPVRRAFSDAFEQEAAKRRLSEALVDEFACVIGAERGLTKEAYLSMDRASWMMQLCQPGREIAFLLYQRFRRVMHDELRVLSMFDLVNDFLQYLDSNTWDLLRSENGYDTVLVDEFHLFNKQEGLTFRYLLRTTDETRVLLALDPRQNPTNTFASWAGASGSRVSDALGGDVRDHNLDQVFRYTKQIDDVVRALEDQWYFDLGSDWDIPPRVANNEGKVPTGEVCPTLKSSIARGIKIARAGVGAGQSVALVLLGANSYAVANQEITGNARRKAVFIESRDDTAAVESWGRRFVVGQPEYLAGLQFDHVIIADASENRIDRGDERWVVRRKVWSSLYLAMTRAKSELTLLASEDEQGFLSLLGPAINAGLILVKE